MRTLLVGKRGLVLLYFVCVAATAFGCDQLPAGETLWVRLAAPISTYTAKVGEPVHAVLTQDVVCDNEVVLPMGTPIEGVVLKRHKVGLGIVHETATLELEFDRAEVMPGVTVAFKARVEEVENAREQVKNGVIEGVLSSDTFQGRINSRLIHLPTWNPYSDPVLIVYKAAFPIFPEPEIYYPAGTDMRLETTSEVSLTPEVVSAEHAPALDADAGPEQSEQMDQLVEQLPWRVTTKKHVDADVVNIVFVGSRDEVKGAFREAGWHNADRGSTRTVMKNLYALLNNSGYERQPMMTFMLDGKPEDMNWQRSLNSYGRRDHLRIWQWTGQIDGEPVWAGSSTHDTSAVLAVKHIGFVHHVAPDIDDERSAVIRDLNFAGCVRSVSYVARPEVPAEVRNATGDEMYTDGSVAVVTLQRCRPEDPQLDMDLKGASFKAGNIAFRFVRRQILTFRNDIWRANIIYGAYDVGRMTVMALRHHPAVAPSSGETLAKKTKPPVAYGGQ